MLKPKLERHLASYADFHRHPMNVACHKIGMPLIIFNAVALLDWVVLGRVAGLEITLAYPIYVAVVLWYLSLNVKLGLIMAAAYGACIPLGWIAPWSVIIGAGVVGWAVQFLGHIVWEKRSPAFLTNLLQLLIGPLFIAASLVGDWPPKGRDNG